MMRAWATQERWRAGRLPPADRLDFFIEPDLNSGCWLWTGTASGSGYGEMIVAGRRVRAHRLAYERQHGRIPPGAAILHKCDTPACVNPAHLWAGSVAENNADCARKGRARGAPPKVTADQVREIRRRNAAGEPARYIARDYPVGERAVGAIVRGETWRHLLPEGR